MKMREFIDAIETTVDLTEAEQKITEMNPELTEVSSSEDWKLQKERDTALKSIDMLRASLNSFENSFIEHRDSRRINSEDGEYWTSVSERFNKLYRILDDYNF